MRTALASPPFLPPMRAGWRLGGGDGAGHVYASGSFAGSVPGGMAVSWTIVGGGIAGDVNALACDSSGHLFAGPVSLPTPRGRTNIAQWNGSSWLPLGSGINGSVNTLLAFDQAGNLYVAGYFANAGAVAANNIAKWDGAAWSPLGPGTDNNVSCLAVDAAGNVYAGGDFAVAGRGARAMLLRRGRPFVVSPWAQD